VHRAARFVEKPDRARAEELVRAGRFLWNAGMFFFRAGAMLEAIREHLPALGEALDAFADAPLAGEPELVEARYAGLPAVSIDHGVMEKMHELRVVPADFGWSDLGSFATAWELADKDADDNAAPAEAVLLDSARCHVDAPPGKRVALVGVEDLVVVDTADALLVMPRSRAQDVKRVVAALRERGDEEVL
jgi:mannose-1-phosphate guanylyltransferase